MSKETSDTTFTGDADDLVAREQAISDSIAAMEEAANQAAADAIAAEENRVRIEDSIAAALINAQQSSEDFMNAESGIGE